MTTQYTLSVLFCSFEILLYLREWGRDFPSDLPISKECSIYMFLNPYTIALPEREVTVINKNHKLRTSNTN